jgi:hypothetical protein
MLTWLGEMIAGQLLAGRFRSLLDRLKPLFRGRLGTILLTAIWICAIRIGIFGFEIAQGASDSALTRGVLLLLAAALVTLLATLLWRDARRNQLSDRPARESVGVQR